MKFAVAAFAFVALMASAQGAASGRIQDVAFEFEGQEYHLKPIERQIRSDGDDDFVDPDPSGGKYGGGHNKLFCKTIDLPATLSLKVCGCSNPGCPHCPCKNDADIDDKDNNKNKNNANSKTNASVNNNNNQNNNNNNNQNNNNNNNNANNANKSAKKTNNAKLDKKITSTSANLGPDNQHHRFRPRSAFPQWFP